MGPIYLIKDIIFPNDSSVVYNFPFYLFLCLALLLYSFSYFKYIGHKPWSLTKIKERKETQKSIYIILIGSILVFLSFSFFFFFGYLSSSRGLVFPSFVSVPCLIIFLSFLSFSDFSLSLCFFVFSTLFFSVAVSSSVFLLFHVLF